MSESVSNSNELPAGWITTLLKEISEINMGQSPPSATYNNIGDGLPFFQGKAEFSELHPVVEKWCSQPNKIAEPNDILLSVRAPVGTTNIANQRCCIGRGLAAIRYTPSNKFLFYYLRLIEKKMDEKGTGTTFKAISGEVLRNISINIPPLPEQHAIVSKIEQLFSELDKGIESLKTAQQQLKVYRQSVLKSAFEGKLTEKWRQNQDLPDAQELLEKIKKEREEKTKASGKKLKPVSPLTKEEIAVLPALPKGWGWVRLGEVSIGVEYGSAAKSKEAGKVPVLRMGNIQNGKFDWKNLVYTNDDAEIKKYLLSKNDVLFNRTNSPELVGKTAIYKDERPAIFAGYLIRINHLSTIVAADYLNYFLNSYFAKTYGNSVKTDGVNQSNINGERLKGYPFPYCALHEQHQIVQEIESRLSECDNMEATIAISLQQAEALRQSILKKAFEGKLLNEKELEAVRQDPKWEPAERLLERIRAEKDGRHSGRKVGRARHEQNEA